MIVLVYKCCASVGWHQLTVLLEVGLAGGNQLDGDKLEAILPLDRNLRI